MSLDMYPAWWRNVAKKYCFWLSLPDDEAERFYNTFSEVEQKKFDAFLLTIGNSPKKALRELEKMVNNDELDDVHEIVNTLPKEELIKLTKAGLKHGKLIESINKLEKFELQELVELSSLPKNFLVYWCFINELDSKRLHDFGL